MILAPKETRNPILLVSCNRRQRCHGNHGQPNISLVLLRTINNKDKARSDFTHSSTTQVRVTSQVRVRIHRFYFSIFFLLFIPSGCYFRLHNDMLVVLTERFITVWFALNSSSLCTSQIEISTPPPPLPGNPPGILDWQVQRRCVFFSFFFCVPLVTWNEVDIVG